MCCDEALADDREIGCGVFEKCVDGLGSVAVGLKPGRQRAPGWVCGREGVWNLFDAECVLRNEIEERKMMRCDGSRHSPPMPCGPHSVIRWGLASGA